MIETIFIIHHSHFDAGFTVEQPISWELQSRFIDEAIKLAEKHQQTDNTFRWTIESTAVLDYWLKYATDNEVEHLIALERKGLIEITGMFANVTPLFDMDQMLESLQILERLRNDYGFTVTNAMNSDVNGQNWTLVDVLLDCNITGLLMSVNTTFGGVPEPCPSVFNWEGPSGRSIRVNNGWMYKKAWIEGFGHSISQFQNRWKVIQEYLNIIKYPLPVLLLQAIHPSGNNGGVYDFMSFIRTWNVYYKPQIIMATPRQWWDAVNQCSGILATLRGDWTDYWNFGCISSAHEQRINRLSRIQLRTADAIYGVLNQIGSQGDWAHKAFARHRTNAWKNLHLWDEHSWGADISINLPYDDSTRNQWYQKAHFAYDANSLSTLLQRDALGDFSQKVEANISDLLIFNPLPWPRKIAGHVSHFTLNPPGDTVEDTTSTRHYQDHRWKIQSDFYWMKQQNHFLKPVEVPAFGYKVIPRSKLSNSYKTRLLKIGEEVCNHRYIVTLDHKKGGICSLYDKQLKQELLNRASGFNLLTYVHEEVTNKEISNPRDLFFHKVPRDVLAPNSGWQKDWGATRESSCVVLESRICSLPHGTEVTQVLKVKGTEGTLEHNVFLPNFDDYVECTSHWAMTLNTHPEATYLIFPFNLTNVTFRYDLGGQAVIAEKEQLLDVCKDYYTVHNWIDFNDGNVGILVATPENPLVQVGGFHFGYHQSKFEITEATLLTWITNNYWLTNFRAHQPGRVQARFRLLSYSGEFDEVMAHRFGANALQNIPLIQHLGEPKAPTELLPPSASLLSFSNPYIYLLHIKQANNNRGLILRFYNVSEGIQRGEISSVLLQFKSAWVCDAFENNEMVLDIMNNTIEITIEKRRTLIVRCTFNSVKFPHVET
jgi:alpha-mannosidase